MKKFLLIPLVLIGVALVVNPWTASPELEAGPRLKLGDPLPSNLFVELARVVNPSVVNISTTQAPRRGRKRDRYHRDPFFDLFEQFMMPMPRAVPRQALGTGFVIRKDGLILTNNHVVDKADVITVQLSENQSDAYEAEVIGKDARTDIALIKIKPKKELTPATLGTSKGLKVGEWVAAIGNPFGHGHTVTKGIISAMGREIDDLNRFPFIQTDASINPGNSGGPLVNTRGEVIGVNTAIDARAQGIGFAIPIDNVKSIVSTLEKDGYIRRGFIGVYMTNLDEARAKEFGLKTTKGAMITQVIEGGPAKKAGLKAYDFITRFSKHKVESMADLVDAVADTGAGQKVKVEIIREGKRKTLSLKVEPHPDDKSAPLARTKKYDGQKAPFDLGFKVVDYSRHMAQEFGLPDLPKPHPVVIEVLRGSPASRAGLMPGDIVLDVNRKSVSSAKQVLRRLRKNKTNLLRVVRGETAVLIWLRG